MYAAKHYSRIPLLRPPGWGVTLVLKDGCQGFMRKFSYTKKVALKIKERFLIMLSLTKDSAALRDFLLLLIGWSEKIRSV